MASTFRRRYLITYFVIFFGLMWLILSSLGLNAYSGTKIVYIYFSISTGLMLITGCCHNNSYGYLFLTVFFWLGFWLKLTLHTVLSYPFIEPIGSFFSTPSDWDEVLYVASLASLSIVIGKLAYIAIKSRINTMDATTQLIIPAWYEPHRKLFWTVLTAMGVSVVLINMKYGIHHIGLPPRVTLIWPLNSVTAWLLNIGLATGIAMLLWWDIKLNKAPTLGIYLILFEGFISSVSVLSRSIYVFHVVPQLWVTNPFVLITMGWSKRKIFSLTLAFFLFLILSISVISTFRNYLFQSGDYSSTAYQTANARWEVVSGTIGVLREQVKIASITERAILNLKLQKLIKKEMELDLLRAGERTKWINAANTRSAETSILLNEFGYQITDGFSTRILQLSIDRWIGLEGLMAVHSYPDKNMGLMWRALSEKPIGGEPDIYQVVSNSIYLKSDISKFRFASLPGATAFLYYSNSMWVVFLGMTFFSLLVLFVEFFINAATANPILCALYGSVMANNVVQFGVAPRQTIPYMSMLLCGILLVWIIHTNAFTQVLHKFKLIKSPSSRDN